MSNPFYNYDTAFIPGQLARAEAVANEFISVQTGFALLVTQGVDAGVVNAYSVTTSGQPTVAYVDGDTVEFKPRVTNTGPATLSVNAIPAVSILRFNGAALLAGDLTANVWTTATYNSAFNAFTLTGPGQVAVIAGSISLAAPTHKVGLVAAGGVSTQAAPIDATYAIDQSIAPTWTGVHTFTAKPVMNGGLTVTGSGVTMTAASGVVLAVTGVTGQNAATITAPNTSNTSFGLVVQGGTSTSDYALNVLGGSGVAFLKIFGDGGVVVNSPTGGDKGLGTINATGLFVNGAAVLAGTGFVSSVAAGTGIGVSASTGAVTISNTGVLSIAGTANQITASASTGAVTLSLPATITAPGDVIITQSLQVKGTGTAGFAGIGVELFSNGTQGFLQSFDRTGGVFVPTQVGGSAVTLAYGTSGQSPGLVLGSAGNVTIATPTSGSALTVTGLAGAAFANPAVLITSPNTANQSNGITVQAGTSASDSSFTVNNAAGTLNYFVVFGDGGVVVGNPTGSTLGRGTINCTGLFVNGGVVALGRIVVKQPSTTARATVTLSNDAVFTAAIPGAGTYQFRLDSSAQNNGIAGAGIVYNINFSGTFTTGMFAGYGAFEGGTLGASGALISSTVAGSSANVTTINFGAGGSADAGGIMGTLIATGAGTLALSWASTSTTSVSIGNGSLVVERVV